MKGDVVSLNKLFQSVGKYQAHLLMPIAFIVGIIMNHLRFNLRSKLSRMIMNLEMFLVALKRLNSALQALLLTVSKYRNGIGKQVEGYTPFVSWARGSIRVQFVN